MNKYKDFSFLTTVFNEDFIMRDHQVHQTRIMPGVTFLDLIYRSLEAEDYDLSKVELRNVLFEEPLVTDEEYDKTIEISMKNSSSSGKITARSQKVKNNVVLNPNWDLNFQCEMHFEKTVNKAIDLKILKENALRKVDMDEVYAYARQLGINHYEFMKGLGEIFIGKDYYLAEVHLSNLASEYLNYTCLHPVYLDSATLIPSLILMKDSSFSGKDAFALKPSIPIFIESFRATGQLGEKCFVYVPEEKVKVSSSNDVASFDLEIYNAEGRLAVSFNRLVSKQIRTKESITNLKYNGKPLSKKEATDNFLEKFPELTKEAVSKTGHKMQDKIDIPSNNDESTLQGTVELDLQRMIAEILDKRSEEISIDTGFYDLGLDSGNLLKIVRQLEIKLDHKLYPTLLFEYTNVKELAGFLIKEFSDVYGRNIRAVEESGTDVPMRSLFFRHVWKKLELPFAKDAKSLGHMLVFDHGDNLYNGLREVMESGNEAIAGVILVKPGKVFRKVDDSNFEINPENREDYTRMLKDLIIWNITPASIIHLWSDGNSSSTFETIEKGLAQGFYSLLHLTQALIEQKIQHPINLLYIFSTESNMTQPVYSAVNGFTKTLALENPKYIYKTIELKNSGEKRVSFPLEKIIFQEFSEHEVSNTQIRYVENERYVKDLEAVSPDKEIRKGPQIKEEGVYLITGGAGGLGLIFTEFLANHKAKVILSGRSRLSVEQETKIKELEAKGTEVMYIKADISQEGEVKKLIGEIKSRFVGINGVIHCAGVVKDSFILKKTREEMDAVMAPKVHGTLLLDKVLSRENLDFFALFSSTAAVFGNVGQCDYAYCNSFMDNFAQHRETLRQNQKRQGKTIAINWPFWQEGGMKVDGNTESQMRKFGMYPMSTASGLKAFEIVLRLPESQVLVIEGDEKLVTQALGVKDSVALFEKNEFGSTLNSAAQIGSCKNEAENLLHPKDMEIAIIGLSGRYPMADNIEELWDNLCQGKDCITEIPADRWDLRKYHTLNKNDKGKAHCKWGGFIGDVDKFDPLMFNISPREAEAMEPQERLYLETVWHTMEDAGYTRQSLDKDRVGVFVGVMWGQYQLFGVEETQKGNVMSFGSIFAAIANRVSNYFDFRGPSLAVDTMCSSSLTAIHLACDSIRRGESDLAVAGGVNISIHPNKYILLSQNQLVSSDSSHRSFGEGGDGYIPGEGVGAVLLKPLNKAIADRDQIYAVIKASSINHGGKGNGYSVPNPNAQANLILETLRAAKIDPRTISYIEASAVGSELGDPIEVVGLTKAFSAYTSDRQYCSIGTIKSNIGHLESAAGIAGVSKILLQMKYKQLVPSIGSEPQNPNINFAESPFYVQQELTEWRRSVINVDGNDTILPRRAAINSYGAGGSNAHIIFEEYDIPERDKVIRSNEPQVFVLSAKDNERLQVYAGKILAFLLGSNSFKNTIKKNFDLRDLVYTLQVGREALEDRLAMVVSSIDELCSKLSDFCQGKTRVTSLYQDNVKNETEKLRLLVEGKEGKEFLETLINGRKLDQLAQLWVSGIEIDWKQLHTEILPNRITLPVYPFARERCWLPEGKGSGPMGLGNHESKLHPFLAANDSTFKEQCYRNLFNSEDFFIKDHQGLLPAVVYLEMARAAGNLADGEFPVTKLKNIVLTNPIYVTERGKEVYISLYPDGGQVGFSIYTLWEGRERIPHAQGKLLYEPQSGTSTNEFVDVEAVLRRCSGGKKDAEAYYDKLRSFGSYVGPRFMGVQEFYWNENEALSRIGIPPELEEGLVEYVLHPTLTDGAIQTAVAWGFKTMLDTSLSYLPFVLGEVEIVNPSRGICYGYVTRMGNQQTSPTGTDEYNVVLLDEQGQVVVKILSLALRPVQEKFLEAHKAQKELFPALNLDAVGMRQADKDDSSEEIEITSIERLVPGKGQDFLPAFKQDLALIIADLLKISESKIDMRYDLERYGFNSLTLTEFSNRINHKFGLEITPTVFFRYSTLESIGLSLHNEHRDILSRFYEKRMQLVIQAQMVDPENISINKADADSHRESKFRLQFAEKMNVSSEKFGSVFVEPIAIIGMSGVMPQSDNLEIFWRNLKEGKDMVSEIPRDRWNWEDYYGDPMLEGKKTTVKWGAFMREVDKFDPLFFNISFGEAELMDPQERISLQTVWQTIEDAGYKASDLSGTNTGVFLGVCNADYKELLIGSDILTPMTQTMLPNRISYFLNLKGPSEPVDTACSSSLVALHRAVESIQTGNCDMALVGGVNVITCPNLYAIFSKAGMLAEDGKCKTFDKNANGYVRGEGSGVIFLKPLSRAQADGDHIYAVVKGTAINHGGHSTSPTAPNPDAQALVIFSAWDKASIDPTSVSYIEAHGTGTSLGDPIEVDGLKKAFKELYKKWGKSISEEPTCGIGSIKTNIGHLESAAGISGIIKVLLAMKHKKIPGNLHFQELNPYIQLQGSPFYVVNKTIDWGCLVSNDGKEIPRRAGVSSFGVGGVNAHIALEEYVNKIAERYEFSKQQIVVLSAKTPDRLKEYARNLAESVENHNPSLADLAYTLQVGREAMEERLAIVVGTSEELVDKLICFVEGQAVIENLYRGQDKRDKETLEIFTVDEELQESIEKWIRRGKYAKILDLWVNGLVFDWNKLYGDNKPRRISLPTYPFAREHCWAPEIITKSTGSDAATSVITASIHPLLQQNTSDLAEQRFSSTFTGQEFFLKDHVVKGQRVLPGVAYLEMARAAVDLAVGTLEDAQTGIRLKNVVWTQPIVVSDQPVRVHIALFPENNGEIAYEIYREPEIENTEPVVHCQGHAVLSTITKVPALDLPTLQAQCTQRTLTSSQCYEAFKLSGIEYGPAYQGIEVVCVGQDQVLTKLSMPSSVSDSKDQFVLYPSMMDSALQASIGLIMGTGDASDTSRKLGLPFALKELEILNKCTPAMWALVRYSQGCKAGDKVQKLDIDLCDDQGNICVRMKGFSSRVLEGEVVSEGSTVNLGTLMAHPCWQEEAAVQESPFRHYAQHLVVFCEQGEFSPESIEGFMSGVRCLILQSQEKGIDERFQTYAVQVFEEIQKNVNEKVNGQVLVQIVVPNKSERQLFSGLSGLLKTAQLENPKLIGQLIEVDLGEGIEGIVQKLKENSRCPMDDHIRYQGDKRYVPDWREVKAWSETESIPWKDLGIYLITGGTGGLGLIFVREIVQQVREATLILTGRSPLSKDKQAKLEQLEELGAKIVYRQVDVTEKMAVTNLIQSIKEDFGSLHGIIHSAGLIEDNFILKKTKEEFQQVLAPKVTGLVNLDQASKDLSLDFLICFSSGAGVMGNPGQADYSTANAFMDAFAKYRNDLVVSNQRQGKTLSINWPLWKEGGMRLDLETEKMMLENTGLIAMRTQTGIRALYQGLALGKDQVMVMEGHLSNLRDSLGHKKLSSTQLRDEVLNFEDDFEELFEKIAEGKLSKAQFENLIMYEEGK